MLAVKDKLCTGVSSMLNTRSYNDTIGSIMTQEKQRLALDEI